VDGERRAAGPTVSTASANEAARGMMAVHLFCCPQHGQFTASRQWECARTVAGCPGCNAEMREWNEVTNKDGRLGPPSAPRLHRCVCRSTDPAVLESATKADAVDPHLSARGTDSGPRAHPSDS
jgi:hypothetical protein